MSFADGHGGIQSIEKIKTNKLDDTYRITLADTTTFDFIVTNGRAISSVKQTSVSNLTRTYTIAFNDGTSQTFTVTDGRSITDIAKTGANVLTDTYTISYNDGTSNTFTVKNGNGIKSFAKVSTVGLVDTYRIEYTDNSSSEFTVTNGEKGDKGDNTYTHIKFASQEPTESSHSMGDVPDKWVGFYWGNSAEAPTDWKQYKWYQIKGETGDVGAPATLVSSAVTYQVGDSGTIIPSGNWVSSVPVVAQGKYLWTRQVIRFNTGDPITTYSVARFGIDGSGAVSTVAGIAPDLDGNVPLTAGDVGALPDTGGDLTGPINMNGQPLFGLNAPTEETQAANKGYVDQRVKKAAPRNLLDNSDFRNPVNQRGATSYAGSVYGIDRWEANSGACLLTIENGFVKMSKNSNSTSTATEMLEQYISRNAGNSGKTVTLAAKIKGDSVRLNFNNTDYGDYENYTDWTIVLLTVKIPTSGDTFYAAVQGKNDSVYMCEWVALYEGEYTAETLPEYQPKGYGAELAECLRYYKRAQVPNVSIEWPAGSGIYKNTVNFDIPMRITPTLTLKSSDDEIAIVSVGQTGFHWVVVNSSPNTYLVSWEASADL